MTRTCEPCRAAWGEDVAICDNHDEDTIALAREISRCIQETDPTLEQVGWFMDDAEAVLYLVKKRGEPAGAPWSVKRLPAEGGVSRFEINGLVFYTDPNWEGHTTLEAERADLRGVL